MTKETRQLIKRAKKWIAGYDDYQQMTGCCDYDTDTAEGEAYSLINGLLRLLDKLRKEKLTGKEIEIIQNAMLFFNEAEQTKDKAEDKVFHSAYEKLGDLRLKKYE